VIVAQTDDPALDPLSNGSLRISPVLIRSKGVRAQAVLNFTVADSLPVPISFDVWLRVGDQTTPCGTLWAVKESGGNSSSGEEMTVIFSKSACAGVAVRPEGPPPSGFHGVGGSLRKNCADFEYPRAKQFLAGNRISSD
jgi:hypothetical protein